MESTPRQAGAIRAGHETYALEIAVGARPAHACAAAVMAGVRAHETVVLHRISSAAEVAAACLLAEPGGRYSSQAAAIMWFAERILALPALADGGQYQPSPGDIIEVTLTGTVRAAGTGGWTLAERGTGRQYQFAAPGTTGAPRLQVLDLARRSRVSGDLKPGSLPTEDDHRDVRSQPAQVPGLADLFCQRGRRCRSACRRRG